MMKLTLLIVCLAIAANQVYSQDMLLDLLKSKSCPQYDGMEDLDYKKVIFIFLMIIFYKIKN